MTKVITFSRWREPLLRDDDLNDADGFDNIDPFERQFRDLCASSMGAPPITANKTRHSIISGPFGVVSLHDRDRLTDYNLWVFKTNFDITQRVMERIERTPGVLACNAWSRYHGRIAIGHLFDEEVVQESIRYALTFTPKRLTSKDFAVQAIADTLDARNCDWVIIEGAKGELLPHSVKDAEEADAILLLQKQRASELGSSRTPTIIERSWERDVH